MNDPVDIESRRMIVASLDQSILVEAGAGSGKTRSLVERMLALIGSGKSTVDRMAAVTFTRKAAAEMRGRFQVGLEEVLRKEKDPVKHERYGVALERIDLLFSGTIHSFCARLLRERPIEAKLDPDFQELEEEENFILRDQCWAEYLEGLQAEDAPQLKALLDLGIDPRDLKAVYQGMVLYPEVDPVRKRLDPPDFSKERKVLGEYLKQTEKRLPREVPENGWDGLQRILKQSLRQMGYLDMSRAPDFLKVLKTLDKKPNVTLYKWPSKEIAKEQEGKFEEFKSNVVSPCLSRWQAYCHYFIMELVIPAVDFFRGYRGKNSLMNFHDLLLRASTLLRDYPEVRQYFQERFTHILLDEFQDTDPIQVEVLLYLTGEDVKEQSWQKTKVRPGALFIVGDPKQSIYRFRRADIDSYNEVKRIIKDSGGLVIPLVSNFRSLPSLCDWINPIFEKKFPAESDRFQAAHELLVPYRQSKGGGVKRISIGKVKGNKKEEVAEQDAERIASWIDWALKGDYRIIRTEEEKREGKPENPEPGDFMILLGYKAYLPIYARALEAWGIPFEISGGGAFKESEEIQHLLNLLSALADPENQVALLSVLRGPFYGVSDDLLYRFKKGGGIFSFLSPQERCKDQEAKLRIETIFSDLSQFYQLTRRKPPGAALGIILDRLGIIPHSLTRDLRDSRSGNLFKLFELAYWEASKEITSFAEMVDRLNRYYSEVDVEGMSVEPGKRAAVRLMNLHKAKGLEAPVVFLADPLKEVSHEPEIHISRTGRKAGGFFVATISKGEWKSEVAGLPPDWNAHAELEKRYQEAEKERLLYVATTRAKQLLVVSHYPEKKEAGVWASLSPYLEQVEELEAPRTEKKMIKRTKIRPEEFMGNREDVIKRFSRCKIPSYTTMSVTEKVKGSSKTMPFSEGTGLGMSWGRVIHRILESLSKDERIDLEKMAENLLKGEGRPLSEKETIVSVSKGVMASELWGRMHKSEKAFFEVPFFHKQVDEKVPKLVSGTIDLVFKEGDGWVIADYKSDKIDGNLETLINYYKPQVEMYTDFWKEITGEKVKEAGLYFIDAGEWVVL